MAERVRVIAVGNAWRRDDGAGLVVGERVRAATSDVNVDLWEGEPTSLVDAFEGAGWVVIVDAVSTGAPPGTIYRFDLGHGPVPEPFRARGTHAVSIGAAIELARVLGRLPGRLVLYGIEGADFTSGSGLSPAVERAIGAVSDQIVSEIGRAHVSR